MDTQGLFTASLLDASCSALAGGALARLEPAQAGEPAHGAFGARAVRIDLESRLAHLAQAVAAGRKELLEHEVCWMTANLHQGGVDRGILLRGLEALELELAESLPTDSVPQVTEILRAAAKACRQWQPSQAPAPQNSALAEKLIVGDRAAASQSLMASLAQSNGHSPHIESVSDAMLDVGLRWQSGAIDVAQEHLASETLRGALSDLRATRNTGGSRQVVALIAAVAGNSHDLGARMVSDEFEHAGWEAVNLGANVPIDDLVAAAKRHKPRVVLLSASLVLQTRATARALTALREACTATLIVGGTLFRSVPELWRDVGADGYASSAHEAVAQAEALLTQ